MNALFFRFPAFYRYLATAIPKNHVLLKCRYFILFFNLMDIITVKLQKNYLEKVSFKKLINLVPFTPKENVV